MLTFLSFSRLFHLDRCVALAAVVCFAACDSNNGAANHATTDTANVRAKTPAMRLASGTPTCQMQQESSATDAATNVTAYYNMLKSVGLVVATTPAATNDDTLKNALYFYIDKDDFAALMTDTAATGIIVQLGYVPANAAKPNSDPQKGTLRPYLRPVKDDGKTRVYLDRNSYYYVDCGCPNMCDVQ